MPSSHPARRTLIRLGLGSTVLVVSVVVVEVLLRLTGVGSPVHSSPLRVGGRVLETRLTVPDPELLYRPASNVEFLGYYRTNSRGWRGPEPLDPKPGDVLRIVCVGDSSTMGLGVHERQAWPFQLQAMLRRALPAERRVEVLDLGVTGYSSWHNRRQLEVALPGLQADVVVVMPTGVNDHAPTLGRTDGEALTAARSWTGRLRRTHLARLLELASADEQGREAAPGEGVARVSEEEFVANVGAMQATLRELRVPLVLVAAPHSAAGRERTARYERATALVADIAERAGTPLADPRDDVRAAEPRALFVDPVHPDPVGHRLIAVTVLEQLLRHPTLLADVPTRAFLTRWLEVRRDGLGGEPRWLLDETVGPRPRLYVELLEQALAAGGRQPVAGLTDPDGLDPDSAQGLWRRFDPLTGVERGPYGEGALRRAAWLHGRAGRSAQAAQALARAELMARHVQPRDTYGRLVDDGAFGDGFADPRRDAAARALAAFERAVLGDPGARDRRVALAELWFADGHRALAVTLLGEVLALVPDAADALHALATMFDRMGLRGAAGDFTARAVELAPEAAESLSALGLRRFREGCLDEAEGLLRRALDARPLMLTARYVLARVLLAGGELDEAEYLLRTTRAVSAKAFPDIDELLAGIARRRADAAAGGRLGDDPGA